MPMIHAAQRRLPAYAAASFPLPMLLCLPLLGLSPPAGAQQPGAAQPGAQAAGQVRPLPPAQAPAPHPDTAQCLARLRPQAPANGVALADFDRYTRGATLLETTVAQARRQPEREEPWWDYIAKTVDDERVEQGRARLAESREDLRRIADAYEVDPEVLVAIFGIETNYGAQLGRTRVLDAWLTRACTEGRTLWTRNVYAALRLLGDGTVREDAFTGSWSGAFGMTQFIPTSFYELAADGDGDGRIDLYGSLADAYASTANHLRKRQARWTRGLPAVLEVRLPAAVAAGVPRSAGREYLGGERLTLAQWAGRGVRRVDGGELLAATDAQGGRPAGDSPAGGGTAGDVSAGDMPAGDSPAGDRPAALPAQASARLFAPTGANGPIFLATGNFDAILHYNGSHMYGLAVGLLAERLRGGPPLATAWPTDDPGLSRAQVRELQSLLIARGHDLGGPPDGIAGARTREAVLQEQRRLGLAPDGRAGLRVLQALRAD